MKNEEHKKPRSLLEEILNSVFAELEKDKDFDPASLNKVKALAAAGALSKPAEVMVAIQSTEKTQ